MQVAFQLSHQILLHQQLLHQQQLHQLLVLRHLLQEVVLVSLIFVKSSIILSIVHPTISYYFEQQSQTILYYYDFNITPPLQILICGLGKGPFTATTVNVI